MKTNRYIKLSLCLSFFYILLLSSCSDNNEEKEHNTYPQDNSTVKIFEEINLNEFDVINIEQGQRFELDPDLNGSRNKQISIINDSFIIIDDLVQPQVIYQYNLQTFELINKTVLEQSDRCILRGNNIAVFNISKSEITYYDEAMNVISVIPIKQNDNTVSYIYNETITLIDDKYIIYSPHYEGYYIYDFKKSIIIPVSDELDEKNSISYTFVYPTQNNRFLLSGIIHKRGVNVNGNKDEYGNIIPFNHSYIVVNLNGVIEDYFSLSDLDANNLVISADNQSVYSLKFQKEDYPEFEFEYIINRVIKDSLLEGLFKKKLLDFNNKKIYDLSGEYGTLRSSCSNAEKVVALFCENPLEIDGVIIEDEKNYVIVI